MAPAAAGGVGARARRLPHAAAAAWCGLTPRSPHGAHRTSGDERWSLTQNAASRGHGPARCASRARREAARTRCRHALARMGGPQCAPQACSMPHTAPDLVLCKCCDRAHPKPHSSRRRPGCPAACICPRRRLPAMQGCGAPGRPRAIGHERAPVTSAACSRGSSAPNSAPVVISSVSVLKSAYTLRRPPPAHGPSSSRRVSAAIACHSVPVSACHGSKTGRQASCVWGGHRHPPLPETCCAR